MLKTEDLSFDKQKKAFEMFRQEANYDYVLFNRSISSAQEISTVLLSKNTGVCVGLTPDTWDKEFKGRADTFWLYHCSIDTKKWSRDGEFRIGTYSQISVGLTDDGVFIAHLDGQDKPGVLRKSDAEKLEDAKLDELELPALEKTSKYLKVKAISGRRSSFVLLQKDADSCQMLVIHYLSALKKWQVAKSIKLSSTEDVSVIEISGKLYYAYLTTVDKKVEVRLGVTTIPAEGIDRRHELHVGRKRD